MDPDLRRRAAAIRLLLLDADGVLTDGVVLNIPAAAPGTAFETKGFHSQDGIALQWLVQRGVQTGLISGRVSQAVEIRARQLGMAYLYQGRLEKLPVLDEIAGRSGLPLTSIAYAGDDLPDLPIMRRVGLAFAPSNARAEVKKAAHYVTEASGGHGAVREMVELLMQAGGTWAEILKNYEAD
ncbi:MAG TPA: HAD hydrolase family protein [Bryobacteraceae bacterium]|nr:HAD hydrolase family protein [Bryobacteraceae bacterium]